MGVVWPSSGAMYGRFPGYGSQALGVRHEFSGPVNEFKGGELISEDGSVYYGNYKSETEEKGTRPQPPTPFAATGYISQPRQDFGGYLPYYYDYRFLTGQYPRGTYTHSSISHTHGLNNWRDAHYVREYYASRPERQSQTSSDPAVSHNVETSRQQLNPVVYQGSAMRQQLPQQETVGQTGFYLLMPGQFGGMEKV